GQLDAFRSRDRGFGQAGLRQALDVANTHANYQSGVLQFTVIATVIGHKAATQEQGAGGESRQSEEFDAIHVHFLRYERSFRALWFHAFIVLLSESRAGTGRRSIS